MKLVYGEVSQQDLLNPLPLYRVLLTSGELSPWMPALALVAGSDRANHALSVGTQVALMLNDYEGLILGAVNSSLKPAVTDRDTLNRTVYADGAVIEYDSLNHQLNAILPTGATMQLVSDGGISINGDITLNGNINQTGTITSSGDHLAAGISLSGHTHTGDSGGTTGAPL